MGILLDALSDPTRQKILLYFYQTKVESCVNDIAKSCVVSRPTVSHHLQIMKRAGVLKTRKEGKNIFYSFNKENVVKKIEHFLEFLKGCC